MQDSEEEEEDSNITRNHPAIFLEHMDIPQRMLMGANKLDMARTKHHNMARTKHHKDMPRTKHHKDMPRTKHHKDMARTKHHKDTVSPPFLADTVATAVATPLGTASPPAMGEVV